MVHIPISESKDIDILSFEESRKTRENSLSYNQDKWIYYPNFYSEYRYILGTVGNKPIIVIGINPSTAEPDNIDNTIKSIERLTLKNGYDSYIMCNVYAQRATEPNAMDEFFNYKLHQENIKAFRWIFNRVKGNPTIWAAWGTNIKRVGQDGGDDFFAVRRVQQLQLQKLAHIFRVVLFEQGNHFVQYRSALPLRVVGYGEEYTIISPNHYQVILVDIET